MDILFYIALTMTLLLTAIMGYDIFINAFNKRFPMWFERLISHALVANVFLWVIVVFVGF